MQAVNETPSQVQSNPTPAIQLQLSVEVIAYIVLIAVVLIFRLAQLGTIPMSPQEAIQALPAVHAVNPDAAGTPLPSSSPITLWLQMISFSFLGATELAARFSGVIAGVLFVLTPLLFRDRFGRDFTFLFSVILAASPIAFTASRVADPALWTAIFAMGSLWSVWCYWDTRETYDALVFAGIFGAFLFLTDPSALGLLIVLVISLVITFWWTLLNAPEERDTPGDELILAVREFFAGFPVQQMSLVAVLTVLIAGSGFFLYPSALNSIAQLIIQGFRDLIVRPDGAPPVFALLAIVTYNPLLLLFAVIGVALILIENRASFPERFIVVWGAVSFLGLFLYQGSTPADALWVILPASCLTAYVALQMMTNYSPIFLYSERAYVGDANRYWWLKWFLSAIFAGFMVMLVVHVGEVGRGLMGIPDGSSLLIFSEAQFRLARFSLIWVVITSMFIVVITFLLASIWGNMTGVQALGLGVFLFMLGLNFGTGWTTSVENVTDPAELWFTNNPTHDTYLLRETLLEIADRDSKGVPTVPIAVVQQDNPAFAESSLIAWLLRDFSNVRFVETVQEATRTEVVIMPDTGIEFRASTQTLEEAETEDAIDLGGSYVAQTFNLQQRWSVSQLGLYDWLAWFMQRRTHEVYENQPTLLWLRIDLYDGSPVNSQFNQNP